ncbi:hypothetical protein EVAR_97511_1 [Eumeta japonica]|uniref:Reverse transcriptase domain-containing protein n=1 Tax=Eumeta variegata TaxID=151549 RepID=A0A4C1WL97_EUMVA|nr:hypothetical protein EVAR_97511_1 [Eumeta japonica]
MNAIVKVASTTLPSGGPGPPISMRRLKEIVQRLPNTRANFNGISAEIMLETSKIAAAEIAIMYRKVMEKGRQVGLLVGGWAGWNAFTMGCPQRSVMGPSLSTLLLNDIFSLPMPTEYRLFAYADDVTAVIEGHRQGKIPTGPDTLNGGYVHRDGCKHQSVRNHNGQFVKLWVFRKGDSQTSGKVLRQDVLGVCHLMRNQITGTQNYIQGYLCCSYNVCGSSMIQQGLIPGGEELVIKNAATCLDLNY